MVECFPKDTLGTCIVSYEERFRITVYSAGNWYDHHFETAGQTVNSLVYWFSQQIDSTIPCTK